MCVVIYLYRLPPLLFGGHCRARATRRFSWRGGAMASRACADLWGSLPLRMKEALVSADAQDAVVVARLVRQTQTSAEVWDCLAGGPYADFDADLDLFDRLRNAAFEVARRKRDKERETTDLELDVKRLRTNKERKQQEEEEFYARGRAGRGVPLPPPPSSRAAVPRSRLRRGVRPGDDDATASAKDGRVRSGYVDEIVDVLIGLCCPTAEAAATSADPRATLSLVAAGRRASTLRARLRAWRAFVKWLQAAHGEPWPSSWRRLLDYMMARVAEPCGKSTLLSIVYAATFWEKAAGWRLTDDPLWEPAVQELLSRITGRSGGRASTSAPPYLASHLALLETLVMDESEDPWLRCFSGWKACKSWAVLRFGDHRGMGPHLVEEYADRTTFTLTSTKTTGKGKKVETRYATISAGAYLVQEGWLRRWLALLREVAPQARDYLMTSPSSNLMGHGLQARELSYAEAAGWTKRLTRRFGLALGMSPEASEYMTSYFTEHSERSFLPTVCMGIGHAEEALRPLGGWGASATQKYMKAAISRTLELQDEAAERLRRAWDRRDFYGEKQEIEKLAKYLSQRGMSDDEALRQAQLNRMTKDDDEETRVLEDICGDELDSPEAGEVPRVSGTAASSSGVNPAPVTTPATRRHHDLMPATEHGYVISIASKTGFRRLHFLGACPRVPGVHFLDYELCGNQAPAADEYDDHCRQCWPPAGTPRTGAKGSAAASTIEGRGDPETSEADEDHSSSTDREA